MPVVEGEAPIFFTHIPKCAGTSIHGVLEPKFSANKVFLTGKGRDRTSFLATPTKYLAHLEYCGGHLSDFDCTYKIGVAHRMTTVRHPADRLQSIMNHAIRGGWAGKNEFQAYKDGNTSALNRYLTGQYYQGASMLSYFSTHHRPDVINPSDITSEFAISTAERVAKTYNLVLSENDIDHFVQGVRPDTRYDVETRRMVGKDLGEYTDFSSLFDDKVMSMLDPDLQFYEQALKSRTSLQTPLRGKTKRSWILDWEESNDCFNFTHRKEALLKSSFQERTISRIMQKEYATLHVPFRAGSSQFSGLIGLRDIDDSKKFYLQLNGENVPCRIVTLSPREFLFYGNLQSHPHDGEWLFGFSEKPESPLVWLNDFAVHEMDRSTH